MATDYITRNPNLLLASQYLWQQFTFMKSVVYCLKCLECRYFGRFCQSGIHSDNKWQQNSEADQGGDTFWQHDTMGVTPDLPPAMLLQGAVRARGLMPF